MSLKRVLIVDDEPAIREVIRFELEDRPFEFFEASSAREAVEILKNNTIDIIVSDVRMSGGDGVYLLNELRSIPGAPPVIMMSGFSDHSEEGLIEKGALRLLKKPTDLQNIGPILDETLARR